MKLVIEKFKESAVSILPIVGIVCILALTPLFNINRDEVVIFIVSSILLIFGMTLFNIGAALSMTPMGEYAGAGLVKTKKLTLILTVALIMGFLVTIAEPDLTVLAHQVSNVINGTSFILSVGVGVSVFLLIAILKVIFNRQLSIFLLLFYMLIFAITALLCEVGKNSLIPIAYDSGGVTTGPITVPFVMAFGVGIATTLGGRYANENSFGFVALCSIGPILVVLLFLLGIKGDVAYTLPNYSMETIFEEGILNIVIVHARAVIRALMFIFVFFLILNYFIMKLPMKKILQIVAGILLTYIGLVVFLTSASTGFMTIGYKLGTQIIKININIAIFICFIIGMTVVLAEPAIHVLTAQVETVTSGSVSRRSMLIALSIGVGLAIVLSALRIIYKFSILYYLIPGYFLSLGL